MLHETIRELKPSHHVLQLDESDVVSFVRRCVKERSLSSLISSLNHDLMFGTLDEQDSAARALARLGFV
ncbi:hypothetical protein [uncultured Roseobacter sp.]|uniref:hypothetical protein n=1 Tax=uncultured Roseobacter sp. TaxID=114847 RepID=UPI0026202C8C|nr:hypothetical protein [uncultured Roseobacter sp.]